MGPEITQLISGKTGAEFPQSQSCSQTATK